MADTIDKSKLDSFTPEVVAQDAFGYLRNITVMPQLVNTNYENEVAKYGETVVIPKRGTLSSNDKAANTAITLNNPADSDVSVTLSNHKEVSFLIEDVAKAFANQDTMVGYLKDAMAVLAEDIENSLLGLYSGFSSTDVGTYGTDISPNVVTEARRTLLDNKVPVQERKYLVMSTKDEENLLQQEKFTSAAWLDDQGLALKEASLGRRYGVDLFVSQLVPTTSASPTQTHNICFARDAMALVTRPLELIPETYGVKCANVYDEESGLSMRVTLSYNPDYMGMQATVDILYGVAELRDEFGVEVRS